MNLKESFLTLGAGLATLLLGVGSAHSRDLYWTEYTSADGGIVTIMASDIDGSNPTAIVQPVGMGSFAVDIAVSSEYIFWTGHSGGDIWRAKRDGSEPQRIIESWQGLVNPHGITADQAAGKIYFACLSNGIFSADFNGQNLSNVVTPTDAGGASDFATVALGAANELLWATVADQNLYRSALPGGGAPTATFMGGGNQNYGLAYDPVSNIVYYTLWAGANNPGSLFSFNLNTSENRLLMSGLVGPLGLDLSPSRTHLIIAHRGNGIGVYQISDGVYRRLVAAPFAHFGVAVATDPGVLLPAAPGEVLFSADFENDAVGAAPRLVGGGGVWNISSSTSATAGLASVVTDTQNIFGFGRDNQFLRFQSARGFSLRGDFHATEVATMSFDFVGHYPAGDANRWLNVQLRIGGTTAHITSLRMANATFRTHAASNDPAAAPAWPTPQGNTGPINPSYGGNYLPIRISTIMNNSAAAVSYNGPDGQTYTVSAAHATVWVYDYNTQVWSHVFPEFIYSRAAAAAGGLMNNIFFQVDGNAELRSYDLDNVSVVLGAHVPAPAAREFPRYPNLDFENIPTGTVIASDWGRFLHGDMTALSFHTNYTSKLTAEPDGYVPPRAEIAFDTTNRFGRGTANQIFRTNGARGWRINSQNTHDDEVVMLRFEMDLRGRFVTPTEQVNQLTVRFWGGDGTFITENVLGQMFLQADQTGGFFTIHGHRIPFDQVNRFELVMNNSAQPLTYADPTGRDRTLRAGNLDVWLNGKLVQASSRTGRHASMAPGPVRGTRIESISTQPWDAEFDNIQVFPGVQLQPTDPVTSPSPEPRELLVYEGFDYNAGDLEGKNGGLGWVSPYTVLTGFASAEVVSPGLTFGALEQSGNSVSATGSARNFRRVDIGGISHEMLEMGAANPYIGAPGSRVYLSAVVDPILPLASPFWGFGLYRNTDEQSGEVLFIGKATNGTLWRFAGGGGSSGGVTSTAPIDGKALLVVRIDYDPAGNVAYLFHNPDLSAGEPPLGAAVATLTLSSGNFGFDRIRIAGNDSGFRLDELRIGTTWAAVTPAGDLPPSGYATWSQQQFGPEFGNPAISGPQADPDGDGIPNLLEYVLGRNPLGASRSGLPAKGVNVFTVDGLTAPYLTLTFAVPDSVTDVQWSVLTSGDLISWADNSVFVNSVSNGDGSTTYTYRDSIPVTSGSRRFLLLSVEQQ